LEGFSKTLLYSKKWTWVGIYKIKKFFWVNIISCSSEVAYGWQDSDRKFVFSSPSFLDSFGNESPFICQRECATGIKCSEGEIKYVSPYFNLHLLGWDITFYTDYVEFRYIGSMLIQKTTSLLPDYRCKVKTGIIFFLINHQSLL
jgi:hypothetical protein